MNKRNIACFALSAVLLLSGCGGNNAPSGTEREKDVTTASETEGTTTAESTTTSSTTTVMTTTTLEITEDASTPAATEVSPNELPNGDYALSDDIARLINNNKLVYSLFYEKDCTDTQVEGSVYTVKMTDFNDFGSFYDFVSSTYTKDEVDRLFNDFQGKGRSFWEENGQFLVDMNAVTFTVATALYSDNDVIEVMSESEKEIKIIYWFDKPKYLNVNDELVFKPFGLKISVIKENGIWKLSEMILPSWKPQNVVFREDFS